MTKKTNLIMQNKIFIYIAAAIGLLLSIPLIAMQFTNGVDWSSSDFIIMGTLMFSMASIFVIASRRKPKHQILFGVVIGIIFLLIWAHLAVGIVDTWPLAGS